MTELEKAKANLEQIRQILEGVYEDGKLAGASALAECERDVQDKEIGRWQTAIRACVIKASGASEEEIDGTGCESGDPLDLSLTEIELGFAHLDDDLSEIK